MKWTKIRIAAITVAGIGGAVIGLVIDPPNSFIFAVIFGLCVGTIGGLIEGVK